MYKIFSIAKYTFVSNFRNRIFWVLILFGLLLLASSVLFGLLGQEQEIRMLVDLGLAAIEILSFLVAVFLMVNLILEEMESKTIYLVLTRAISKIEYLLGKFLGALTSLSVCLIIMTLAHFLLLYLKGWKFQEEGLLYLLTIFMSFEKLLLISALALFFSLFSSSGLTAMVFSFFFWTLGHFAMELKFLSNEIQNQFSKWLIKGIYFLIPHFQYLNARDLWIAVSDRLSSFVIEGSLYTLFYSSFLLALSFAIFRKKEF